MFSEIIEMIEDTQKDWSKFLSNGRAQDYADYKRVVGIICGLECAKSFVKRVEMNEGEENSDYID